MITQTYSIKSDVWAWGNSVFFFVYLFNFVSGGILVCEMFSRKDPYPEMPPLQSSVLVCRGELTHPIPPIVPPFLKQLVTEVIISMISFVNLTFSQSVSVSNQKLVHQQ